MTTSGSACIASSRCTCERGSALVLALAAIGLMLAMGAALVLVGTTETRIAARYARSAEALHALEAVLDRALLDLMAMADWDLALSGGMTSTFVDGPPAGLRRVAGTIIDLTAATAELQCGRAACAPGDLTAVSALRPWGVNNPLWQPFAWGPASAITGIPADRDVYAIVWVGDDPADNDGDPRRDGTAPGNPGRWTVRVTAHAFGAAGLRRRLDATVTRAGPVPPTINGRPVTPEARAGPAPAQVLSWREVR